MLPDKGFTFKADEAAPLVLICDACGDHVCTVEEGDDLDIIMQTAQDHRDDCEADS